MDIEKINIKGLLREQIKELRDDGISLSEIEKFGEKEQEEALDRIFKWACPDLDAGKITPGEALELYVQIIQKTYAGENLLKKLKSPPLSSSARGDSTVKNAKKRSSRRRGTAPKSKKKHG